jgi:hypothetical protein
MNLPNPLSAAVPSLTATLFPQTSRYFGLEVKKLTIGKDREVAYLSRRFVPAPDRFEQLTEHTVSEKERPDILAATYLGDPEQFWRLADANYDLNPFELTATVNRRLRITLPEGVSAPPPLT